MNETPCWQQGKIIWRANCFSGLIVRAEFCQGGHLSLEAFSPVAYGLVAFNRIPLFSIALPQSTVPAILSTLVRLFLHSFGSLSDLLSHFACGNMRNRLRNRGFPALASPISVVLLATMQLQTNHASQWILLHVMNVIFILMLYFKN